MNPGRPTSAEVGCGAGSLIVLAEEDAVECGPSLRSVECGPSLRSTAVTAVDVQYPLQSCSRGEGGIMEDMRQGIMILRAEAYLDY